MLLEKSYECIQKGDFKEAQKHLLQASELDEQNIKVWSNLGVIEKKLKNYEKAIEYYNKGLSINPQDTNLLSNIGSLLIQLKDFKQAVSFLKKALSINDKTASVWNNLGSCYFHFGQYEQAQVCYEKALQLEQNNPTTAFNLSWCLLRIGEFQRGFRLYENRFIKNEDKAIIKNIHSPRWQHQSLLDKPQAKLCLTAEQGFGDTLQFIRFIPRLLKTKLVTPEQIVVHIQPECQQLITHSYPQLTVIDNTQAEPQESAFHIPLMSLPLMCQLDALNIPNISYLTSSRENQTHWKKYLPNKTNSKSIGIVWQGSLSNIAASHRSIDFDLFMSIFKKCPSPIHLINLNTQSETQEKLQAFAENSNKEYQNVTFHHLEEPIKNFDDTAAIIQNIDLVITIDTAVAHLSGALGKNTFALIPYAHDWRWFKDINYSPWYPSMYLFRQQKWHDWNSILPVLTKALHQWLT